MGFGLAAGRIGQRRIGQVYNAAWMSVFRAVRQITQAFIRSRTAGEISVTFHPSDGGLPAAHHHEAPR
jgi:hypothetical protein